MQTKNTTKQILFLIFSLLVAEGVFGLSLFWPILFTLKDKKWVYWLALVCGIFLSLIYNRSVGPMSIFLVMVLALAFNFLGEGREMGKWIIYLSIVTSIVFEIVFGLKVNWGEVVVLGLWSAWVTRLFGSSETIKLNL